MFAGTSLDPIETAGNWYSLGDGWLPFTVALIAVAIAVVDHFRQRRHDRLSVVPKIDFEHQSRDGIVSIIAANNGIGPARVISTDVFVDGKLAIFNREGVEGFGALIRALDFGPGRFKMQATLPGIKVFLRPGQEIFLVKFKDIPDLTQQHHIRDVLTRLRIEIHYESIYGDKQSHSSGGTIAT